MTICRPHRVSPVVRSGIAVRSVEREPGVGHLPGMLAAASQRIRNAFQLRRLFERLDAVPPRAHSIAIEEHAKNDTKNDTKDNAQIDPETRVTC